MVSLSQLIQEAFPSASPLIDFEVTDAGNGEFITMWDESNLGKRPNRDELTGTYPNLEMYRSNLESIQEDAKNRKVWECSASFWGNFTDTEKLAILSSTVAGIILLREELRLWTGEVWSDDPRVQAGLAGLVSVGILTNDRKQAMLMQ